MATQQTEELRQQARAALEANDVDGALDAYGQILEANPNDAEASEQYGILAGEITQGLLRDADKAMRNKRFEKARAALHKCLEIDPKNKAAKGRLARMRKQEQSKKVGMIVWGGVIAVLLIGLGVAGIWIYNSVNMNEGQTLLAQGDFENAKMTFEKVGKFGGVGINHVELADHKQFTQNMIDLIAAVGEHNYRKCHFLLKENWGFLPDHPQLELQREFMEGEQEPWFKERLKDGDDFIKQNEFDVCRSKVLDVIKKRGVPTLIKRPESKELALRNDISELLYQGDSLLEERELWEARGKFLQAIGMMEGQALKGGDKLHARALNGKKETRMASIALAGTIDRPHQAPVSSLAWTGDGKFLCSTSQDGNLIVWDGSNLGKVKEIRIGQQEAFTVDGSPDGRHIAAASFTEIQVLDASGLSTQTTLSGHDQNRPIRAVRYSWSGNLFGSGSTGRLTVWRSSGYSEAGQTDIGKGTINAVSFSTDDKYVACGSFSGDRTVRIYDVEDFSTTVGEIALADVDDEISDVQFSPDSRYLIFTTVRGRIHVHEAKPPFQRIKRGEDWDQREKITSSSFSKDGKYLVTGTSLGTIRVWEMDKFKLTWVKEKAHIQEINDVSISPTSFVIASGGFDKIKFWKPEE